MSESEGHGSYFNFKGTAQSQREILLDPSRKLLCNVLKQQLIGSGDCTCFQWRFFTDEGGVIFCHPTALQKK